MTVGRLSSVAVLEDRASFDSAQQRAPQDEVDEDIEGFLAPKRSA
jgi:hypothetical protein